MATVTTTFTPTGQLRTFDRSNDPAAPFAELSFIVPTLTIPAKDAANESEVVISCTFPRNFVYRLQSLEIFGASTSLAVFDDLEKVWTVSITESQVVTRRFGLYNRVQANEGVTSFKIDPDATTNDFGTYWSPDAHIANQLINAGQGSSIMSIQLMDTTSDATAAVFITFRGLALVYNVGQYNEAPINSVIWTAD